MNADKVESHGAVAGQVERSVRPQRERPLEWTWNWRKYPGSVLLIAGPLALLAFGLHITVGVLRLAHEGDPWFLVIALSGVALLALGLWPLRKRLLRPNAEVQRRAR